MVEKKLRETEVSKEEQIGFHKGSLATLAKERNELTRMASIVDALLKAHIDALKKLGVDVTQAQER